MPGQRGARPDAAKQHRMRPGHVRPSDEQAVCVVDVVGRPARVGAERLVTGDRAAHAAAVGVDVVRADQTLAILLRRNSPRSATGRRRKTHRVSVRCCTMAAKRSARQLLRPRPAVAAPRRAANATHRLQQALVAGHALGRGQVQRAGPWCTGGQVGPDGPRRALAADLRAVDPMDDDTAADANTGRCCTSRSRQSATPSAPRREQSISAATQRHLPFSTFTAKRGALADVDPARRARRRRGLSSSCAAGGRRCGRTRCPANSGPPFVRQRSSSANTSRPALRKNTQPPAPDGGARSARRARDVVDAADQLFQSLIHKAAFCSNRHGLNWRVDARLVELEPRIGSPSSANCSRSHSALRPSGRRGCALFT